MSPSAKLRSLRRQFFSPDFVIFGPSLKRSFSAFRRSWELFFGYVSGIVGRNGIFEKKKKCLLWVGAGSKISAGREYESQNNDIIFKWLKEQLNDIKSLQGCEKWILRKILHRYSDSKKFSTFFFRSIFFFRKWKIFFWKWWFFW